MFHELFRLTTYIVAQTAVVFCYKNQIHIYIFNLKFILSINN